MSDSREIEKRIEEVLMEHGRRIDPNHPGYGNCRCGFVVDLPQDQAAHVAAAVVANLQLTEESRVFVFTGTRSRTWTKRRWVGPWSEALHDAQQVQA